MINHLVECQVRLSKFKKEPVLFYLGDYGETICFCFSEGHSECVGYFRLNSCTPLDKNTQVAALLKFQEYYDSIPSEIRIELVLKQRLKRVKICKP